MTPLIAMRRPALPTWVPPALGPTSEVLGKASAINLASLSTPRQLVHVIRPADTLAERIYKALSGFKLKTAAVAMHLDDVSRLRLFRHLDSLLNADSWDPDDEVPSEASFTTLLRMILFMGGRRPALGVTSNGNFIATWTEGRDRLTIECKPGDRVRWVLVYDRDDARESAAGEVTVTRLPEVLSPYAPARRWFPLAAQAPA